MAVKIIKPGKKRKVICSECECVMEYEKEDVQIQQTGMNDYFYYIKCPCCESEIPVEFFIDIL